MTADADGLRPAWHEPRHVGADDGLSEDRSIEVVADGPVGALPHARQPKLLTRVEARALGSNRRTFARQQRAYGVRLLSSERVEEKFMYLDTRFVRGNGCTLNCHVVTLGGLRRIQCHLGRTTVSTEGRSGQDCFIARGSKPSYLDDGRLRERPCPASGLGSRC